jgi:hypothetical protein
VLARPLESYRPSDGEHGWLSRLQFVADSQDLPETLHRFVAAALLDPRSGAGPRSSGLELLSLLHTTTRRAPARPAATPEATSGWLGRQAS